VGVCDAAASQASLRDAGDEEEAGPAVFAPATAAHLRGLADALLRNGESGAFKAYVEVLLPPLLPLSFSQRGGRSATKFA
jgi:hypothetical protein